jgi:hypothetical protein
MSLYANSISSITPWAFTLFITEVHIDSLVAANKAKPGTFDNIYIEYEITSPYNNTSSNILLECRKGCTGTISQKHSLARDIVFYGHEVLLRNCRADWTRFKFALCKYQEYKTARELTKLTEDSQIERKILCWGEMSMPWTAGPQYFHCNEELHFLDTNSQKQYAGRLMFKVQKTIDGI